MVDNMIRKRIAEGKLKKVKLYLLTNKQKYISHHAHANG